jgi:thiol-disulfide isomerase/thioredoxin
LKEKQTFVLLAIVLGFKFARRQSTDGFLADGFFFSKGAIAVLSFYIDLRICVYYMLFFLVLSLLYPQPVFRGESRLVNLTPAALAHILKEQANEKMKMKWLIVFFAPWAPQCVHLEPVFAEISMKYTSKQLRFGKIDVSRWPIAAKDHKIFIQNGNVDQLPTIIMFENGKETGRIPHVYDDGTVAVKRLYKDDIIAAFGLNDVK